MKRSGTRTGVFLGLGSNMGDRRGNLERALALLEESGACRVVRVSTFRETAAWGVEDPKKLESQDGPTKPLVEEFGLLLLEEMDVTQRAVAVGTTEPLAVQT